MFKQMCWLSINGTNGEKVLHLRTEPNQPWRPYKDFPQYTVPDYEMMGGSKGWATYQKLQREGWNLAPSTQLQQSSLGQSRKSA